MALATLNILNYLSIYSSQESLVFTTFFSQSSPILTSHHVYSVMISLLQQNIPPSIQYLSYSPLISLCQLFSIFGGPRSHLFSLEYYIQFQNSLIDSVKKILCLQTKLITPKIGQSISIYYISQRIDGLNYFHHTLIQSKVIFERNIIKI